MATSFLAAVMWPSNTVLYDGLGKIKGIAEILKLWKLSECDKHRFSKGTIRYPLLADANTGIYPHSGSQYHYKTISRSQDRIRTTWSDNISYISFTKSYIGQFWEKRVANDVIASKSPVLAWINFNPSMDKLLHHLWWNHVSILKHQRWGCWSLGMDKLFEPTHMIAYPCWVLS